MTKSNKKNSKPLLIFPVLSLLVVTIVFLLVYLISARPVARTESQINLLVPYSSTVGDEPGIYLYPESPAPGDFLIIEATPLPVDGDVEVLFNFPGFISDHYRVGENYYLVIAISYDTEPGSYEVQVKSDNGQMSGFMVSKAVAIVEKDFHVSRFSVPPSATVGWTAERLAEDREKTRIARETTEPYPLWLQEFILPLEGRISSEYAAIRYINENPPRRHNGIDFAADEGLPVVATNRGIVRLAEFLLSGGNTVIIDHGLNLSSTYMHLETLTVTAGQTIERGEQIGTVGMTGYASGPHLHWELNIGQVPVNPLQLLENDLLWIPPAYVQTMLD